MIRERYSSDLSEAEFALIFPWLPAPKRRGPKPTGAREILDALLFDPIGLSLAAAAEGLPPIHDGAELGSTPGATADPGGHIFPEGDQQLSGQGNDQYLPDSAAIELDPLMEPLRQYRTWLMSHHNQASWIIVVRSRGFPALETRCS